jgi:hypothetical protein
VIAELSFNGTELVLDLDAILAAQSEQVFALQAQLTRQCEDTNFLDSQAVLPVCCPSGPIHASLAR